MQQHKEQRVGVFVDVQNLYYSAKSLYNSKVNFKEVLREAVKNRSLIRAIAYCIRADIPDEQNFYDALKNIGYEVKTKELQTFVGGAKKGDWDVGLAMDAIEVGAKLDTVVVVSGDGDFVPLVEHIKHVLGSRVEVMAFRQTTSGKLREAAHLYVDMDKNKKYLIRGPATRAQRAGGKPGARPAARPPTRPAVKSAARPAPKPAPSKPAASK